MSDVSGGRPSPQEARRPIFQDLDLTEAVRGARAAYHWTDEEAAEAELEYRRFLWLTYQHDGPAGALHGDADKLWHYHILDTRKYAADCDQILGRYIHHTPAHAVSEGERQAAYQRGLERYEAEYNRPMPRPGILCV